MKVQGRSIAVIEDDHCVRRALHKLLVSMGCLVASFESAEAFLESGDPGRFECLLVDVELRRMSGPDLVSELSRSGLDLPAVFMSGSRGAGSAIRRRGGAGATFLRKPFDAERLEAAIATASAAERPRRPTEE
jgi:FixJ family two-component response regulator